MNDFAFYGILFAGALVLFAVIIFIGVVIRAIKAPPGERMREAFRLRPPVDDEDEDDRSDPRS
ncbi:hypothetical protein [Agromyces italicus]|uniref:hypothetical protein n=1 Tax=Agromyces italicus TaxID=279572 RepID=UPI0003B701A1|nr:hypothetical protein [Agromyces italicus]